MSEADRHKWNERYATGAYRARTHPSEWLETWLPRIREDLAASAPTALDVACGAGRNALFLAERGFRVVGVDISAEGLARARAAAIDRGLAVDWLEHDLEAGLPGAASFDLVVVFRYVNLPLLEELTVRLNPGGYLLCEQHLATDADVTGPREPSFRVAPGVLAERMAGLEVVASEEGITADPDGARVALARLAARRVASGGASSRASRA